MNAVLRKSKLSSPLRKSLRRQLIFGQALMDEVSTAKTNNIKNRRSLSSMVSGQIVKKYRMVSRLSENLGFSRRTLTKVNTKWESRIRDRRNRLQQKFSEEVREFYERDDNSRAQPGKADYTSKDGTKTQKRVLTDYLKNLYEKFKSEHISIHISLSTFSRMRPHHIQTTSFITRSSCLCTKHQNMALILKSLKREGLSVPSNPETYLDDTLSVDNLSAKLPDDIRISQWKRTKIEEKNKVKSVMRIVENSMSKQDFTGWFLKETDDFRDHVTRMRTQYGQIKVLKERLPEHHVVVHMDFAENYSCRSVEEVQSAYWNKTAVTLHPTVVYYKEQEQLMHKSFVFVSDEMSHSTPTVLSILDILIPHLKEMDPLLHTVHYWTDGPTSQYRNKVIFNTVANHMQVYGTHAKWNYFECGHGKGPCDGLGGTTKRMADEAVNSARVSIQDANDFYEWAVQSSMKASFFFVSAADCSATSTRMEKKKLKPLKGTFKLHAVVGLGQSQIAINDTSCYCTQCIAGELCESWSTVRIEEMQTEKTGVEDTMIQDTHVEESHIGEAHEALQDQNLKTPEPEYASYNNGDFVAAVYQNNDAKWYVGKIVDGENGDQYEITFMEQRKQLYQWPKKKDMIWVDRSSILCKITEPQPTAKRGRMFKILPHDAENIEQKFDSWNDLN